MTVGGNEENADTMGEQHVLFMYGQCFECRSTILILSKGGREEMELDRGVGLGYQRLSLR